APAFRPVRQDRPPVVAVLNFKGGVGKTTLTANLAATFAGHGERVLMIDLDYQGSLTSLVLPNSDLRVAAAECRLAQDLFVAGEQDLWDELAVQCRDVWGRSVDVCPTVVPQRAAFRRAANRHQLAIHEDPEVRTIFAQLASDLNERMPRESRRTAPIPR